MSSVSSVSGAGQGLYQFIQSLSAGGATQAASAASPTDAAGSSSSGQAVQGAGRHHHGGGGKFKQIEDAVTSALQTAQSSGTAQDPNQIIESAIAKVLKNVGSATPATGSTTQAAGPGQDGDTAGATGAGASSSAAASSNRNSFLQALQSLGVSPQQFHSDFLAAIKDAQGGNPNPATAFASFPPGATLDTVG